MAFEYLNQFKNKCDVEALTKIKQQRELKLSLEANQKYVDLLSKLTDVEESALSIKDGVVQVKGLPDEVSKEVIDSQLKMLIPWRKGPFDIFGEYLDAEWRSDFKWDRLKDSIGSLKNKVVLDIGCNNGYFLFRMAEHNPKLALGIDPFVHYWAQFNYLNHYAKQECLKFELLGAENVCNFKEIFDCVFYMGILYHQRNPIEQLMDIKDSIKPGGQIILETLGIPGDESYSLVPEDRYAKMKNVWFLPTLSCSINMLKRLNFIDIEVLDQTVLKSDEQRLTKWCPPPRQSLEEFLDPEDPSRTVEGHLAPMRFCISARTKFKQKRRHT